MKNLIVVALLSLVAPLLGGSASPRPLTPTIEQLADTVVTITWPSVQTPDQQIAHYVWELYQAPATRLQSGTTNQLRVTVTIPKPAIADSVVVFAKVWAVSTRGKAGKVATSAPFTLRSIDPGPIAPDPVIIRDTLVVAAFFGQPGQHQHHAMAVGDSAEVCVMLQITGSGTAEFVPAPVPVTLKSTLPQYVGFSEAPAPSGPHCRWLRAYAVIPDLQNLGLKSLPTLSLRNP